MSRKKLQPPSHHSGGAARSRVLLLLPLPPPHAGPEEIADGIVRELRQRGLDQYLVLNSTIRTINRQKGKLDLSGMFRFIGIYFRFLAALLRTRVVFFYMCSSRIGFLRDSIYVLTARLFGRAVVAQYHGGNFDGFYRARSGIYRAYVRFVLRRLTRLLAVGESLVSMFNSIIESGRVSFLRNGVDPSVFPEKSYRSEGPFTVLFVGHLTFPKGFYDLVLAYGKLREELGADISLIFAGERVGRKPGLAVFLNDHWAPRFLEAIDKITSTIEDFVDNAPDMGARYLGVVGPEERLRALREADLFVLPSYSEGLSMSCIEAMTAGLPVVSTPVGAMSEIIIDGQGGLLTEVGAPDKLASKIRELYADRQRCNEMGRFNRRFVEENLTIGSVATELHLIMQQVTGQEPVK